MRRKRIGVCHLCGTHGTLSFEHVPPRAAFNDRPLVAKAIDDLLGFRNASSPRSSIFQRGAGAYTLCTQCNSKTGHWYGKQYVDWVYQGMLILQAASQAPSLYYTFHVLPLRVIKQIICMFFSVNTDVFHKAQPALQRFVLNAAERHLPPHVRIYAFYAVGNSARQSGVTGRLTVLGSRKTAIFSEIAFPPFGYVLSFDRAPHEEMADISYFSECRWNEYRALTLRLPVLPTVSYFPGDYRAQPEIDPKIKANPLT